MSKIIDEQIVPLIDDLESTVILFQDRHVIRARVLLPPEIRKYQNPQVLILLAFDGVTNRQGQVVLRCEDIFRDSDYEHPRLAARRWGLDMLRRVSRDLHMARGQDRWRKLHASKRKPGV